MITIVITYRNRDLMIVRKCLDSLSGQTVAGFKAIMVDYGSDTAFAVQLKDMAKDYSFLQLIACPVNGQLWNKSRAINIALKSTVTPYFLVADADMVFHRDFLKTAQEQASENSITYFRNGFLSKQESLENKKFEDLKASFFGDEQITGITLFPTDKLKALSGYDEFYHGWGAEDTDMHTRFVNSGLKTNFYTDRILLLHQWHAKPYRNKQSGSPFHSRLEKINSEYLSITASTKRSVANHAMEWGVVPLPADYKILNGEPGIRLHIEPTDAMLSAALAQFKNFGNELVQLTIKEVPPMKRRRQLLKKIIGKRPVIYLDMESINNLLLEEIIKNYRNRPYDYAFNRKQGIIQLKIKF